MRQHNFVRQTEREMDTLLQADQVAELNKLAAEGPTEHVRRRARILLMYHDGKTTREIAEAVGITPGRVSYWRREFLKRGMDIFSPGGSTSAAPKAAESKAAKPKAAKPKAGKPKAAKPKAAKSKSAKKQAKEPVPLSDGLVKKAEKVVVGVAGILGTKARKQLDAITSQESFQEFVAYVRKQRKKLLKKLDAEGLKKKQIRFLRAQLKELEAQIAKAEKLLRKLEG